MKSELKKRGPKLKDVLVKHNPRGNKPACLHLTPINGSLFYDQYGRVLHESAGEDRIVDLRPVGLWDARSRLVMFQ